MLSITLLSNILLLAALAQAKGIMDFLNHFWSQNGTLIQNPNNPYCSICCVDMTQKYRGRICGIHTMCAYETKPVGAACRGLLKMEFSKNEMDAIVEAHNILRNRVALVQENHGNPGPQYPASNMRLMSWDKELAKVADRWAAQCVFDHDKCRDLERFPVGQNIVKGAYGSKGDLEHIADWYELVDEFNKDFAKIYNGLDMEQFSPYTQLVWADTYLVGCARVSFQTTSANGQFVYNEHFVCNYGPSGNIPHQSVYKIGEACSACPEGTFCTNPEYPGLCNQGSNNSLLRTKRPKVKELVIVNNEGKRLRPIEIVLVYLYIFVSKDFLI